MAKYAKLFFGNPLVELPAASAFIDHTIDKFDLVKTAFRAISVLSHRCELALLDITGKFAFLYIIELETDTGGYHTQDDQGDIDICHRSPRHVINKDLITQYHFDYRITATDQGEVNAKSGPIII